MFIKLTNIIIDLQHIIAVTKQDDFFGDGAEKVYTVHTLDGSSFNISKDDYDALVARL